MNQIRIKYILINFMILCCLIPFAAKSQMTDMTIFQSNMRSKAANQFYQEEFQRIGANKVKGNSYLLKGKNVVDLYTTLGYGANMPLVFDTYTQQASLLLENKKDIVALNQEELDSFYIKVDNDGKFTEPAFFINASKIDASKKLYLQRLTNGLKYNLYKSFIAEMRPAAMDLAQTNVKEFEIVSEYYYLDMVSKESFIKIKPKAKNLKEIFKEQKAALDILNTMSSESLELKLIAFFDKINT